MGGAFRRGIRRGFGGDAACAFSYARLLARPIERSGETANIFPAISTQEDSMDKEQAKDKAADQDGGKASRGGL